MTFIEKPLEIEKKSFEIIDEIIEKKYPSYTFDTKFEKEIITRCIHTSADFDYLENIKISDNFKKNIEGIALNNLTIFTDTTMALAGINKKMLSHFGIDIKCFISDEDIVKKAKELSVTRSKVSADKVLAYQGDKLIVCGNAPTFLHRIVSNISKDKGNIVGIIGVVVGFVGAKEAKEELYSTKEAEYVVSLGRKGGSNISAAIVNAITYYLKENE